MYHLLLELFAFLLSDLRSPGWEVQNMIPTVQSLNFKLTELDKVIHSLMPKVYFGTALYCFTHFWLSISNFTTVCFPFGPYVCFGRVAVCWARSKCGSYEWVYIYLRYL